MPNPRPAAYLEKLIAEALDTMGCHPNITGMLVAVLILNRQPIRAPKKTARDANEANASPS